jgi:hypothetical protein
VSLRGQVRGGGAAHDIGWEGAVLFRHEGLTDGIAPKSLHALGGKRSESLAGIDLAGGRYRLDARGATDDLHLDV